MTGKNISMQNLSIAIVDARCVDFMTHRVLEIAFNRQASKEELEDYLDLYFDMVMDYPIQTTLDV